MSSQAPLRVASGGAQLAVFERGNADGPPLLFLHGYPDTHALWSQVQDELADRFRLISYDTRGIGASSAPAGLAAWDLARLAEDVIAVADATVGAQQPVHLVGHDWGTIAGFEVVSDSRFAGRIATFTAIAGPSLDHGVRLMRRRVREGDLALVAAQTLRSYYIYGLSVPGMPALAWRLLAPRWATLLASREGIANARPAPTLARDGTRGAAIYRRNIWRRLLRPRSDLDAHAPVQLVTCERDRFISPRVHDELERWIGHLERRTLPCGHWAPLAMPGQVAKLVARFV